MTSLKWSDKQRLGLLTMGLFGAAGLVACGGSDSSSSSAYSDHPPARVAPVLADISIPATLVPSQSKAKASSLLTAKASDLPAISTVDPATVLGGGSVTNPFQPANKNFTLVEGMSGRPLPTGKWYKSFFYQSPRNLDVPLGIQGDAREQSVFAFPNQAWLDDRMGMVNVAFPRKRYIPKPGALLDMSNPYYVDAAPYIMVPSPNPDLQLTYLPASGGRLTRRIDHKDELTVATSWYGKTANGAGLPSMQIIMAAGSPYITAKYLNLRPQIGLGQGLRAQEAKDPVTRLPIDPGKGDPNKWEAIPEIHAVSADNGEVKPFAENGGAPTTPDLTGKKFRFVYRTSDNSVSSDPNLAFMQRVMVVYTSSPVTLTWDIPSRTYVFSQPFNGTVRTAFVNEEPIASAPAPTVVSYAAEEALLDKHSVEYPVTSSINLQYAGGNDSTVRYGWSTETLDGSTASGNRLLMMAFDQLHLKSMANAPTVALKYRSNFGTMTGVIGNSWTQTLKIPEVLQHSSQAEQLWQGAGTIKPADRAPVLASLRADAASVKGYIAHCNYESYLCGKYVGNIARLVLIAAQLGDEGRDIRNEMLDFLKSTLNPWFDAKDDDDPEWSAKLTKKMQDYFRYDVTNGGTVTNRPFLQNDYEQDFYNATYLDHMFHYGYFLYASAVLGRYDTPWRDKYKEAVNTLARDIANYSSEDTYFPITRTYDWFRMQNVADAGPDANGGNTESSSEAIHADYGLVLWGAATGNPEMQAMGMIMAAGEIRSAQSMYQVTPTNSVFQDVTPIEIPLKGGGSVTADPNKLITVGIKRFNLTETQVFFGQRETYRVGIQILPISPLSSYILSREWASHHAKALLQLEANDTALFDKLFAGSPVGAQCGTTATGAPSLMPAADCAGQARVLYSWRQIINSANGLNDPAAAFQRYTSYMAKLPQQTTSFMANSVGTPFSYVDSNTKEVVSGTYAAPGVDPDILKDASTPSNNTNVLWWLSTLKQ
ncbi:glycosyl hydrolase [Ottowia thiooxydans]|uniref:glycosyl hydrolase n=1 Tax=Ottowia thiooxydans TaxID=219182 RepID=UPI0004155D13|nr:glycosyl hydrolase [Ottowia thiooxydans]